MSTSIDLLTHYSAALDRQNPDLEQSLRTWERRAPEVSRFEVGPGDFALQRLMRRMDLPEQRILDISFGGGRYLQAFLQLGAQVSGVEISPEMVRHTRERLERAGLPFDPEQLVCQAWEQIDLAAQGWQAAFDLVFLYMSPAVSSVAMLEKVLQASRQSVFITLYSHREDSLLHALQAEFEQPVQPLTARRDHDLLNIFNTLYLWGHHPELVFEERKKTSAHAVDAIFERYSSWLLKGELDTEAQRQRLRQALERRAQAGLVSTESRDLIGHLYLDQRLKR